MVVNSIITLRKLRKNLRLQRAELQAIQRKKLVSLIHHAYKNVPYYHNLFDSAGITPDDIQGVEDLPKIPTTGKLKLQSLPPEEILAHGTDINNCVSTMTSGSTGIPIHVYFTKEDFMMRSLVFIRTFMETGYTLTDRQAIVCDTRFVTEKKYWFQKLGIFRKKYIPAQFEAAKQIELLMEYQPDYIHGYPSSLGLIANEMLKKGVHTISPRMVCTGAEVVTPKTREAINQVFGVDMIDTYAANESGMTAWECQVHKGYHINIDSVVLEFLRNGKPVSAGEPGEVVLTNLHSYAMPIIRYEIGDVCVPSDDYCPCGKEFPLMSIVEGRTSDMIYTAHGKVFSPNSITCLVKSVEGIAQFKVIQESKERFLVQLVKGKGFPSDAPKTVERLLKEFIGEEMSVDVHIVEEIPKEASGKIRSVISKVT